MNIKTYDNWTGSLSEYLNVGDVVDERLVNHFLNLLPPAYNSSILIQYGEPYSYVDNKIVYITFAKENNNWIFKGYCYIGENINRLKN